MKETEGILHLSKIEIQDRIFYIVFTLALCVAGVLLPEIAHLLGGASSGMTFLPIHIPVLVAALMLGKGSGAIVACSSILLNHFLTGMPAQAVLPMMLVELATYGIVCGTLQKRGCNMWLNLVITLFAGRTVKAIGLIVLQTIFSITFSPVSSVWTATIAGIPGILIQLIFVPIVVILLRKAFHMGK